MTGIPIVFRAHRRMNKGTGRLGNKRATGDHPNYGIIKIGQNSKKSPGVLKRLDLA